MSKFDKIVAPSIKEIFINKITSMILSNDLKVGERLPSERELSEAMGISKTVVHEGMRDLAKNGFITIKPQSGAYVADYMVTGTIDTFNAIASFSGNRLTKEVLLGILDFRLGIEGLVMRRFAENHTAEDMESMKKLTQDIAETVSREDVGISEIAELFFVWHHRLALLSRSTLMPLVFNTVKAVSMDIWRRYLLVHGIGESIDLLNEFLVLLENRDGQGAYNLLEREINNYIGAAVSGETGY